MTLPNPSEGHRKRLREKFIESGLTAFHDYEIVELLLTLGSPRKDCKQPAKEAIQRFKTLRGVLEARPEELQEIRGIGPHNSFGIKLVQQVAREFLKEKLADRPVFSSSKEIFEYLFHSMRDLKKEVFKILYLNSQNQIIDTEDAFHGTVNASSIHVRDVVENALRNSAVSLIFAHNHPSGNPEPSRSDYEITRDLVEAGEIMGIKVLDHLIIGNNTYFSFAGEGFIEQCGIDFASHKTRNPIRPKTPEIQSAPFDRL